MAATTFVDEPTDVVALHVVKTPGVVGGRARVAGTRVAVADIVASRDANGWTAEEIVREIPVLTLADVHAALAYYYDHTAEIEESVRADCAYVAEVASGGRAG